MRFTILHTGTLGVLSLSCKERDARAMRLGNVSQLRAKRILADFVFIIKTRGIHCVSSFLSPKLNTPDENSPRFHHYATFAGVRREESFADN